MKTNQETLVKEEKSVLHEIKEGYVRRKHKEPGFVPKEARYVKGQKKRPTQDMQAQTEASITMKPHGLLVLHMVTLLF